MKRILLLSLLVLSTCLSFGQQKGFFRYQVGNIFVSFRNDQRTDTVVAVQATSTSHISSWTWNVYKVTDLFTKTLYTFSFEEDPNFIIPDEGFYDLELIAKTPTDTWTQRWNDVFFVDQPQFVAADADIVVNLSTGSYYHDFGGLDNSGLKILITGSGTNYFQPVGLKGTAGNPVRVQVDRVTGAHLTAPAGPQQGFWLNNCEYVRVDGFLRDHTNGLFLEDVDNNTPQVLAVTGVFKSIQVKGITVSQTRNVGFTPSAAIAFIPGNPNATYNSATYQSADNFIWHCTVSQSRDENVYFMLNNDDAVAGYRPVKSYNAVIAWNTLLNAGRDGLQVASTIKGRIHDNYINTCGLNHVQFQESMISWNGGNSNCIVANNFGVNSEMIWNIQMGNNPWDTFNGETTPGPIYFMDNVMYINNYTAGTTLEPDAIYIQNSSAVTCPGCNWHVNLTGNTIISQDKWNAESLSYTGSAAITHTWVNNVFVKFGTNSGRTSPELNYAGTNHNQTSTLNNIVRDYPTISDLYFNSIATFDFTISSFLSAVYGGSPSNLVSTYPALSEFNDKSGFPALAPGYPYTFGAYSGYDKRVVVPVTGDPLPATFTTPVTVSSVTQSTGTLGYEANKIGLLYWVVSTTDVFPSSTQVRTGKQASGTAAPFSGSLIDLGTVTSKIISGFSESVNYYLFCIFVTHDNVEQASVTRVAFVTPADTTPPTIGTFTIPDANRNHINFVSSKFITATTFAHFSAATPTKTISSIHIEASSTTGHYFVVSVPYTISDVAPTLAYSGGDNWKDVSVAQNSLAPFGATAITNNIVPEPAENIVWVNGVNVSIAGNNVSSTTSSANARSNQIIPAASDGYVEYDYASISRSNSQGARFGLISATDTRTFANVKMSLDVRANNENVDVYQGSGFVSPTISNLQASAGIVAYRFYINRTTQKISLYTTTDRVTYTWRRDITGTVTGDLRAAYVSGDATRGVVNGIIQANAGLQ